MFYSLHIFRIFLWAITHVINQFQSSPSVFSAGLDIMEMYKPDPEKVKQFWSTLQEVWLKLYGSAYPTAAAISVRALHYSLVPIQKKTNTSF